MKTTLRVSVRDLAELMLRSGDLEATGFGQTRTVDAIRLHQKLQRSRPEGYLSEVTVAKTIETGDFILNIGGRIDGVFETGGKAIIEEIKTTHDDPRAATEKMNTVHWGQATCYAFLYAEREGRDKMGIRLTYINIDTEETEMSERSMTFGELESFFSDLVSRYLAWAATIAHWMKTRDESIRLAGFPFGEYRPGQKKMAAEVFRTIRDRGRILVQAPTGIGKTMAALFPAVKAIPECGIEKIFYLTAKTPVKTVAEKTIEDMRAAGIRLKSLAITAKERICFSPGKGCTAEECPFAEGHYDRIRDAVGDAFAGDALTRETIVLLARQHRVCPFELSLDLALWADCIICDYNYAFDPHAYLRRFFEEGKGAYVFLVDEAHNLPDRAREMFSATIDKRHILELRKAVKGSLDSVHRALSGINRALLDYWKKRGENAGAHVERECPEGLLKPLRRFVTAAERWLVQNKKTNFREALLARYFETTAFLRVSERFDARYAALFDAPDGAVRAKLFCIDPSEQLEEAFERSQAMVLFSATLSPAGYYLATFGLGKETKMLALPSPFPKEHLQVVIADTVSTLYRNRNRTQEDIAGIVEAFLTARKGNYLVFFPSYEYMTAVYESFVCRQPTIDTIIQSRGMTEQEREAFLERFTHDNTETLAGFALMGGVFGEGIDLIGDRLTGAAIVGVGLPGISPERDLIRDYFDTLTDNGYEYAYLYPGMTKVLQASGRVIRSTTDRGVILLIDKRYGTARYRDLLPKEWQSVRLSSPDSLPRILASFWRE